MKIQNVDLEPSRVQQLQQEELDLVAFVADVGNPQTKRRKATIRLNTIRAQLYYPGIAKRC